jgi:hypothetical protein
MSETSDLLSGLNADVLNALARKLGAHCASTRKPDAIAALDGLIHGNVQRVLDHLSATERQLLAEAAFGDGRVHAQRFAAKYGVACPLPAAEVYPVSKASVLLLFIGGKYGPLRLPASVAKVLRSALCEPAVATLEVTDSLPAEYSPPQSWRKSASRPIHIHDGERIVFPELRQILKLVQAGKLKVADKSRRPTEVTVRLIDEILLVPDFLLEPPADRVTDYTERAGAVRAHAWGVLVQQCGWAKLKGGRLSLTASGQKLLGAFDVADFAGGIGEFLSDDEFDELNRIPYIRGQSGRGRRHLTPPSERREAICLSMRGWPLDKWLDFDEAARYTQASGNDFEVTEADHFLYFSEMQYGSLSGQGPQINHQYARAFLFESLATLGLIDVAYTYPHSLWPELGDSWGIDELSFCSRYDGLLYVRLNALGEYCLGMVDAYDLPIQQTADTFQVLPNREIVLLTSRQPSAADRHMLELFASRKSDLVWELDGGRILNHLESGGTVEDVLQFLESNTSSPLPETVQTMLSDLSRGAAAIVGAEESILIECMDDHVAALIAHDAQAAKCCYPAGGKRLAIPKKNLRAFRSAIKKLGFIIPNDRIPH